MVKIISIISFGLFLIPNMVFSQYKINIEIIEIRNNIGNIMLEILDENEKIITHEMSSIKEKKCTMTIINLKPGKYAARYFHDENLNGLMDKNFIGIPVEGFGFSNNAVGKFGPPPFGKWLFELTGDMKITLNPLYLK
jgi:uncharacterized protein (DUF2141 family)